MHSLTIQDKKENEIDQCGTCLFLGHDKQHRDNEEQRCPQHALYV